MAKGKCGVCGKNKDLVEIEAHGHTVSAVCKACDGEASVEQLVTAYQTAHLAIPIEVRQRIPFHDVKREVTGRRQAALDAEAEAAAAAAEQPEAGGEDETD